MHGFSLASPYNLSGSFWAGPAYSYGGWYGGYFGGYYGGLPWAWGSSLEVLPAAVGQALAAPVTFGLPSGLLPGLSDLGGAHLADGTWGTSPAGGLFHSVEASAQTTATPDADADANALWSVGLTATGGSLDAGLLPATVELPGLALGGMAWPANGSWGWGGWWGWWGSVYYPAYGSNVVYTHDVLYEDFDTNDNTWGWSYSDTWTNQETITNADGSTTTFDVSFTYDNSGSFHSGSNPSDWSSTYNSHSTFANHVVTTGPNGTSDFSETMTGTHYAHDHEGSHTLNISGSYSSQFHNEWSVQQSSGTVSDTSSYTQDDQRDYDYSVQESGNGYSSYTRTSDSSSSGSHLLQVTGSAVLNGTGENGSETYTYEEATEDDYAYHEVIDLTDTEMNVTEITYDAGGSRSTEWDSLGFRNYSALSVGGLEGQTNDSHHDFHVHDLSGQEYTVHGEGASWTYPLTVNLTGSADRLRTDSGNNTFHGSTGSTTVDNGQENFDKSVHQTLGYTLDATIDYLNGMYQPASLSYDQTSTADRSFHVEGTVSKVTENFDVDDEYPWDLTVTDNYTTDRSSSHSLDIHAAVSGEAVVYTVIGAGSSSALQDNQGSVLWHNDLTATPTDPEEPWLDDPDIPDETDTKNGTDTYTRHEETSNDFTLEETITVQGWLPHLDSFALEISGSRQLNTAGSDTAAMVETGNAAPDLTNTNANLQDNLTLDATIQVAGAGDVFSYTLDQTLGHNYTDTANGGDTSDDLWEDAWVTDEDEPPDPNAPPESGSPEDIYPPEVDDNAGSNTFSDGNNGSDLGSLHKEMAYANWAWTVTDLAVDLAGSGTFNHNGSSSETIAETGNAAPDVSTQTYGNTDNGTTTSHIQVAGSGTTYTKIIDQGMARTFNNTSGGNNNSTDLFAAPAASTTNPNPEAETDAGSGNFIGSSNGTETVSSHKEILFADSTQTVTNLFYELQRAETFSSGDGGSRIATETGNGVPDVSSDTYGNSNNGNKTTHVVITGSGDSYTKTIDTATSRNFTSNSGDNNNYNDLWAEEAGSTQPAETDTSGGNGTSTWTASGSETTSSHQILTFADNTWTETNLVVDTLRAENSTSTDSGSSTSTETGNDEADVSTDTSSGSQTVTQTTSTHLVGANGAYTKTIDLASTTTWNGSGNGSYNFDDLVNLVSGGSEEETGSGTYNSSYNGSETTTLHQVLTYANDTWTVTSFSQDTTRTGTSSDNNSGSEMDAPSAGSASTETFGGTQGRTDSIHIVAAGSGDDYTETIDQTVTINFNESESSLGLGLWDPSDSVDGSATFTLHKVVHHTATADTVDSATLDITGSFTDDDTGLASFHVQLAGNSQGFTTNVEQTNTNLFDQLTLYVRPDNWWLDDLIADIRTMASDRGLGAEETAAPGTTTNQNQVTANTNPDGTTNGFTYTQTSEGLTTTTVVDVAGLLLSQTVADSTTGAILSSTSWTYDDAGNQLTETDALGRTTAWTYDEAGRKTSETLAYGTAQAATTYYAYDAAGNLVQVTDPLGNVWTFAYDEQNREISRTDPLGHTTYKTYDEQGRLASITNRNGLRREFAYDSEGRLTQETWIAGDGVTVVDTLTITYTATGQMASAGNSAGSYVFTYNELGQLVHVDEPFNVSLDFTYDAQGRRTVVQDSFGGTTTSTFDDAGRLLSRLFISAGVSPVGLDQEYDSAGRLSQQTRYSDAAGTQVVATSDYSYDWTGRLTSLVHRDAVNQTLADYLWAYDTAGQLISQTDHGQTWNYNYDDQGQLTGDGTNTWNYDANGNRTTTGYVTGPGNQILTDGEWNYTYDFEGNVSKKVQISDGLTWTYGYDHKNQLIHAEKRTTDGGYLELSADYKYDVFGNRIEKDIDWDGEDSGQAVVTRFAYDCWNPAKPAPIGNENNDVWADIAADGSLTTRYLRSDITDQVFARLGAEGDPFWYLSDYQGSIRDIISNSGLVVDALAYDAFGNIIAESDAQYRGRYAWTGREIDVETDLQYNRARYYDAQTGRWLSQDPLGFDAGDSNLYRYVNNRPTNATDPSGLSRMEIQDLSDGRQALYYVHTNGTGRTIFDVGTFGLGYLSRRFIYGGDFSDPPVFIGYYDPLTGNVQRGNKFVGVERVRTEAESSWGGRPDWDAFFREKAIDFAQRRQMQGVAWRAEMELNLDNEAHLWANRLRELAVDVGVAAVPGLAGVRVARLASIRRLGGSATGAALRSAVAEVVAQRRSFQIATGFRINGLRETTRAQMQHAFFGTGFTPSQHFFERASELRTYNLGVRTYGDLERIIRGGELVDAGGGVGAFVRDGMAILFNRATGVLVNIRPW